ncbi:hypothetical protein LINGRAHAP2_LOCUS7310 [Linum grandiflorum]
MEKHKSASTPIRPMRNYYEATATDIELGKYSTMN